MRRVGRSSGPRDARRERHAVPRVAERPLQNRDAVVHVGDGRRREHLRARPLSPSSRCGPCARAGCRGCGSGRTSRTPRGGCAEDRGVVGERAPDAEAAVPTSGTGSRGARPLRIDEIERCARAVGRRPVDRSALDVPRGVAHDVDGVGATRSSRRRRGSSSGA